MATNVADHAALLDGLACAPRLHTFELGFSKQAEPHTLLLLHGFARNPAARIVRCEGFCPAVEQLLPELNAARAKDGLPPLALEFMPPPNNLFQGS